MSISTSPTDTRTLAAAAPLTPPPRPTIPRSRPPRSQPTPAVQQGAYSNGNGDAALAADSSIATFGPDQPDLAKVKSTRSNSESASGAAAGLQSLPVAMRRGSSSGKDRRPSAGAQGLAVMSTSPLGPPIGLSGTSQSSAQRSAAGQSTASSTTSVHGLLSSSSAHMTSGTGTGTSATPATTAGPSPQHSVHGQGQSQGQGQGAQSQGQTPQTGASKMAAAAKRGLDGVPTASAVGLSKMVQEDEEHPLSEKSLRARDYQTIHTLNRLFHVPSRWRLIRPLGQGAYGLVISVQDSYSGEPVAVKCITRVFDKVILARRALREITLLRHFGGHENLTGLIDLDNVWEGYNEIYLYMEPMEADLHQIIRSGQSLSNPHIQYFLYQLLRGMKYIHTANVIHRDLKPGNLLVNSDCELKICDFGLARGFTPVSGEAGQNDENKLTEYVATRWYRAPEVMLSNKRYTTAIDVWSIGCILAELLGGKPLFKGKDYVDQVNLILSVLGTPDDETLDRLASEKAGAYIRSLPYMAKQDFADIFPDADPDAVDLLAKMLAFNPAERIDVIESLAHPFLASYHDLTDEPACPEIFSKWEEVESLNTIEELRDAISREIAAFREEVRTVDEDDYEYEDDGEGWDMEGGESGDTTVVYASPMPESRETIPDGGILYAHASISPKTTFSPLAKRTSLVAGSPDLRRSPFTPMTELPAGYGGTVPGPRSAAIAGTSRSGSRTREGSPSTPATALSEESFGNPFSGPGSGRTSRRQSNHSMTFSMSGGVGRRPNSFLFNPFGAGMTPMSSTVPAAGPSAGSDSAVASSGAEGGVPMPRERTGSTHSTHSTWGGRRSRAPSQSGINLLIRQLSVVDFEGKGDHRPGEGEEVPPMTVSPSDAPPSEKPKGFPSIT
ncbi:hypothetical protein IAU60_004733 [Kwoniella sp. DSM 27419]